MSALAAQTQQFTTDAMTPGDVHAVCQHLKLPLPTPDVGLERIAHDAGLTLGMIWDRLSSATDVRLMIAAAAMRGTVKRLPPDPRLNPAPLPPTGAPRPPLRSGEVVPFPSAPRIAPPPGPVRGAVPAAVPGSVIVHIGPCPHAPGSVRAERYARYALGQTAEEARAAGVKSSDVERHVSSGAIRFGVPEIVGAATA